MPACAYCWSSDLIRDGTDQRGRAVRACRAALARLGRQDSSPEVSSTSSKRA